MSDTFPDGVGIFETLRTQFGKPIYLERHLQRAQSSATKMKIKLPSQDLIQSQVFQHMQNDPLEGEFGRLRLTFPGAGDLAIFHTQYQIWTNPAKLTRATSVIDESSPLVGIKALPYRENLQILDHARQTGFDDAIRLNSRGEICESAVANLLLRHEGEWTTAPLASGVLPGIMRALVIQWVPVAERALKLVDLKNVDSIFLLSSLRGLQPVESLDSKLLDIDIAFMEKVASFAKGHSVD